MLINQNRRLAYVGLILGINFVGIYYFVNFYFDSGYLPAPFIFDKSNTFMDLFNVLYWAYDDGRYTNWASVYPPLNFIILRIFNFICSGTGFGDPELMRDSSQVLIFWMFVFYLVMPIIVMRLKYWRDITYTERVLLYFAIVISSPMLFALERANLILFAPIFLALVISEAGVSRAASAAILINIKPYFALITIYYVAKRDWKGFIICALLSGLLFLITGLALDDAYLNFFTNLFNFYQEASLFSLREVMAFPSSISAFSYILKHPDGVNFVSEFISVKVISYIALMIELAKFLVLITSLVVLFMRSKIVSAAEIFSLIVVMISNLGIWVGGYTIILYITLIPVFAKMRNKWLCIGLAALMAMPLDVISIYGDFLGIQYVYLTAEYVDIHWTLGLGSVIRPLANLMLLLLLSYNIWLSENSSNENSKNQVFGTGLV
jgi:hypothetical protein